jgi:uncharacterized protein (TIGR04255 family)
MKRTLPPLRLSHSPLVLVLCQVRLAAIRDMASYVPKIQDRLRREGFPVDLSREIQEVTLQPEGPVQAGRRLHWEFRTLDEQWSIIVSEQAVVLQTSAYTDFDEFLRYLTLAMGAVDELVGDLVVERVGLRYVDLVRPREGESWQDYVKPGLHGLQSELFSPERAVLFTQLVADTGPDQRMIARVAQNRDGLVLPPDLMAHHPVLRASGGAQELLTLIDLDHYREQRRPFRMGELVDVGWDLHDGLDRLFRDLVTEHALEVWT